jgi:RNA polymerase sigma-70 factor (ECF subfamily)
VIGASTKPEKDNYLMITTTERVWEDFHIPLKQFIKKRVPDEQSAEDILQDVFLKVHTHIDTLRDHDKLQSWIYQIARNAITDYYRLHKQTLGISDLPELPVLPEDTLDDVVKELTPCIKGMIDRLPPDYRQALILTEYEGLTQKEFAERLGLSFSGAKSRVQRAREKLKQMLLDCCHFQFDRSGRIIDYQPKCACCSTSKACK